MPKTMIHSYGNETDNNMYSEIEFRPSFDKKMAVIYRSLSAKNGLVYDHKLTPNDLALKDWNNNELTLEKVRGKPVVLPELSKLLSELKKVGMLMVPGQAFAPPVKQNIKH